MVRIALDLIGQRPIDLPLLELAMPLAGEQSHQPVDDVGDLLLIGIET